MTTPRPMKIEYFLNPEQLRTWKENQTFDVVTPSGHRYRLYWGYSGNVIRLGPFDRQEARFCAHPDFSDFFADDDMDYRHEALIAQKLLLEHDELHFLEIANYC